MSASAAPAPGAWRDPVHWVIGLAVTAVVARLVTLQWLHPLNWDELEYFAATRWVGMGRVPYRDFWEHHTPLMWFLFAPATWLTGSTGVGAVIAMRWAQIPLWIATFWLANVWMRGAGIGRFARWSSMTLALCSSLFMLPAIEYRVDSLGCLLVMAALVLAQRERWFAAGAVFCVAGFANLRLGPVLVAAVVVVLVRERRRALDMITGGLSALIVAILFFGATASLPEMWEQVWLGNLAEKHATAVAGAFAHRVLVTFGVRVIGTGNVFEPAAFDLAGAAVLLLGAAGIVHAFRRGGAIAGVAILQLVNLAFIAWMKFVYNYHFALVVVLMIPLVAAVLDEVRGRRVVVALLVAGWSMNLFASLFRGKEMDRAYQDRIIREVHERTAPGDSVWSGIPWAFRREPAYRFWFLPELARQLVLTGAADPWDPQVPPGALVVDRNARVWLATVQRELVPLLVHNYVPVWRELWIPAPNARVLPGRAFEWVVPRDGVYRIFVSADLARHPWFRNPMLATSTLEPQESLSVRLPAAGAAGCAWFVDGRPAEPADSVTLRRGQRIAAASRSDEPLAVILLPTPDQVLFRQPPPGATLDAELPRVTHVPRIGVSIRP